MSSSELESSEEVESNFADSSNESSLIDSSNEEEEIMNNVTETNNPVLTNDTSILIELGDRISIDSNQYGKITGIVYYRDNDLIRILPEGVSNKLYDFPLVDNDFDESYGINEVVMLEKRIIDSFVAQHNLRAGQQLSTFTANGDPGEQYEIVRVNETVDRIRIKDADGNESYVNFEFIGIPRDLPYIIINGREKQVAASANIESTEEAIRDNDILPPVAELPQEDEPTDAEIIESIKQNNVQLTNEVDGETDLNIIGFIDVPVLLEISEIPQSQRLYPEDIQKADALNDLLQTLDSAQQKNPQAIRRIRILTEILSYLKNDVIYYDSNGIPQIKSTSVDTLRDMLHNVHVPLGRPVLDIKKRVYYAPTEKKEKKRWGKKKQISEDDEEENKMEEDEIYKLTEEQSKYLYQIPFAEELTNFLDAQQTGKAGESTGYNVNFWMWLPSVLKRFSNSWIPNETGTTNEIWTAVNDGEFFRSVNPGDELPGMVKTHDANVQPFVDKIDFGYERALGSQYRPDEKRRSKLFMEADSAPLKSYLLFPLKEESYMGSTRSGLLAKDIESSQKEPKWMKKILKNNEIEETPTSTGILALGLEGNTLGNISLADYFNSLDLPATSMNGIGDLVSALHPFGIEKMEVSADVYKILQKKSDNYNMNLKLYIQTLRDELSATVGLAAPDGILNAESAAAQDEKLRSDPVLQETLSDLRREAPTLANMDLAKMVHLLNKYPDLTIATLGSDPAILRRAQLRAARDEFLEALYIAKRLQNMDKEKGIEPVKNACEHVEMLQSIKKLSDSTERMQFMVKLLNKYQGEREDNWINCSKCQQHLICLHEFIQIQQFLKPREKQVLQKELILQFAGPLFSGSYTCRNCGQPFAELEYDTNLEYDDEGNPLMGRAVLVDDDAIKQEVLNDALDVPIGSNDSQIEETIGQLLKKPQQKVIYFIAKEIAQRVGIVLDYTSYKIIIKRAMKIVEEQPTRKEYAELTAGKSALDYDMLISRITVIATAVHLLIQIQTRIPNFTIRYTMRGCNPPGFDGYPLGSEDDKTGINYIACAISSIQRNEAPWNTTGFQLERQDATRQKKIAANMESMMRGIINKPDIQISISDKKKYLENTFGSQQGGALSEIIPDHFLPVPYTKTAENAAAEPVVESGNQVTQSQLWIQAGNKLAEKTASILQGSPFADTTCCKSSIHNPGQFWKEQKDLPAISERKMQPSTARGATRLAPYFTPRPMAQLLADAPESIYYRVFLKVCFRGPRMGHLHELGMNLKCPWCDFIFPFHPQLLQTSNPNEKDEMTKQLELSLQTQGVDITPTSFQELLDATHRANIIDKYVSPAFDSNKDFFNNLASLAPSPMTNKDAWLELLQSTRQEFEVLTNDSSQTDIAIALGNLSNIIKQYETEFTKRMTSKMFTVYDNIVKLSFENLAEVILTYFIQPLSRLINNFNSESIVFIQPEYKLGIDHIETIKTKILKPDTNIITKYSKYISKDDNDFIKSKLIFLKQQLCDIKRLCTSIVTNNSGSIGLLQQYIKRALFIIPITEAINDKIIPKDAGSNTTGNIRVIYDILKDCFLKYNFEKLGYSTEAIKQELMIRSEKEKDEFIKFFDKMSEDEKAAEKMKKMLGIGRWAVGGTSAIRIYDADRWDAERAERAAAGIFDFAARPDGDAVPDGRSYDMIGLSDYDAGQDGYDNVQTREDDY
jgi:hypothetical protein